MILFLILILLIWLISKKSEKVRFWQEKIIQQPLNYYLLLGLLVVGFIFRLDYTDRFGCFVSAEPIFELRNILFSAISTTLVLLSFFSKKRTIKLTLDFCFDLTIPKTLVALYPPSLFLNCETYYFLQPLLHWFYCRFFLKNGQVNSRSFHWNCYFGYSNYFYSKADIRLVSQMCQTQLYHCMIQQR